MKKVLKRISLILNRRNLSAGLALGLFCCLAAYTFLGWRNPFPVENTGGEGEKIPDWWEIPPPLTEEEIKFQNWIKAVTYELPEETWPEVWNVGGNQTGVYSLRYQAAFTGYAAAFLGMRTPAYPGATRQILERIIRMLIQKKTWSYVTKYWRDQPWYPDPCAQENIMYTGHLLQTLALYEVLTGDARYRRQGFDLVWDEKTSFHYDTMQLAAVTVAQMRANASGGVTCEPGLIFFPCNNHPQMALKLLEGLGLGDWRAEREKWEKWALSSYYASLGGGAFKLLYHQPSGLFAARGQPGLDGWSLTWYYPWAANAKNCATIWRFAKGHIGLEKYQRNQVADSDGKTGSCCDPVAVAPAAVASFLAPAARVCGDPAAAAILEKWLDGNFLTVTAHQAWLNTKKAWQFGATANRICALAIKNGSDFRQLVQKPLPKEYFTQPYIKKIFPDATPVYQAFRKNNAIILEIDGGQREVNLELANLAAIKNIVGLHETAWHYRDQVLFIKKAGRQVLEIKF